ncbi:MAG: ComEC/Rec2 family competence protein, partial [Thermoanaerobaculia bacterium]
YLSFPLNGFLMPHQILTPGFFLSYLSTYILIKTAPLFENKLKSLLASSFYVQIFIQPFLLYSFGILNWQAILLNPLLIPFAFFFLLFSPIILIFPFPFILKMFDWICFFIFQIIQSSKNYLWWGSFVPFLPLSLLIFYYFFTIFYIEKKGKKGNVLYFLSILLILTLLFHFFTLKKSENGIIFLNVGQGSSTLVKDEFFNILIDTGKRDYFEWLLPSLLKEKVEYLNFLILSHPDEDHDRWAEKIIETIPVGAIGYPEIFSVEYEKLKKEAEKRNTKVIFLKKGSYFKTGNLNFKVLSPEKKLYKDKNEGSLVLQITSKNKSILIMSDATGRVERDALKNLSQKVFALSVGHHGGKGSTSENFLKSLKPRVAIISVGKRNPYSHPSKEVLENLREYKILILRTDQRGDIKINF